MKNCIAISALSVLAVAGVSNAAIVTRTAGVINGLDTTTANYTDTGKVVMTPLLGGVPDTFNANPTRLGIDRPGYTPSNGGGDPLLAEANNNPDSFNDLDRTPGNANDESLSLAFSSTAGLAGIAWDFSRAQVAISGFTNNPGASISGFTTGITVAPTYSAGTLSFTLSGTHFNTADTFLTFSNPAASAGQTLLLKVNDTAQNGSQLAILSVSYEDAITNAAPVVSNTTITVDLTTLATSGSGTMTATDADTSIASFVAGAIPAQIADNFSSTGVNPANISLTGLTFADVGTYAITYTATDNLGAVGTGTLTINVIPEPTTLAALSTVALMTLRRRK
jgi:hypothetical protein